MFGGEVQQHRRTDARNHMLVCGQDNRTRKEERKRALQAGSRNRV